jgi:hypothetical protein
VLTILDGTGERTQIGASTGELLRHRQVIRDIAHGKRLIRRTTASKLMGSYYAIAC